MTAEEYKQQFLEEDAVGWLSIDQELEKLYPNQEPRHFATALHYRLGGKDPLDGISIYESKQQLNHYHFVSYGLSELYYNEEKAGGDFSRWGFELTFRLRPFDEDKETPTWVFSLMQNLARYVFNTGRWFEEFHFIPANGPIRLDTETEITAIGFVLDPELGKIQTPHGEVSFLQMVGLTTAEYDSIKEEPQQLTTLIQQLKETNPFLITDLQRK